MTITQFDPNDWLPTMTRSLQSYVTSQFQDTDLVSVEMSFPNTRDWTKDNPLDKSIIHFEQDDEQSPLWGFGSIGTLEDGPSNTDDDPTVVFVEAHKHHVNFDVGVWCSAQLGGATRRMELVGLLKNLFGPAGARVALQDATGGLWVVSFDGGSMAMDWINDIPLWRAMDMQLIVECFSRHAPTDGEVPIPNIFDQNPELTIIDASGDPEAVDTESGS